MRDEGNGGFRNDLDRNLRSIKMKILTLSGKNNNEEYLDSKKKVELIFYFHLYSEKR